MTFKDISIFSSGGHFVQRSRTVGKSLVEDIMTSISVKIILTLDQWFRRCHLKIILFLVLHPLCSTEQNDLCKLGESIMRIISVK